MIPEYPHIDSVQADFIVDRAFELTHKRALTNDEEELILEAALIIQGRRQRKGCK